MGGNGFWDNQDQARVVINEANRIKERIHPYRDFERRLDDYEVLMEFAEADEHDAASHAEIVREHAAITRDLHDYELQLLLGGRHDKEGAFVTIHSGAGGTEACDWADMLLRMYQRWVEQHGFKSEMIDFQAGEEVGVRSATLQISGDYAYGYLSAERGVHRLVRISPFDAAKKRHTSFASVDVTPDLEDDVNIVILDKDLKTDTFRSGGKGGQNVNKVETAVRITHLPSGVIVACQAERSQLKNKDKAMAQLKAKLFQIEEDKKRAEVDRQYGEKGDVAWGSQIRSYVFQPYQMVKDHRTGWKTGNVAAVMDGDLDEFVEAKLRGLTAGGAAEDDLE